MQQRRVAASGRPSGTDGSDFSYRMVVDSRYTRVAQGKSRLQALIAAQVVNQVIRSLLLFLSASQKEELGNFALLTISIGFISLIIGELGRRRNKINALRLYIIMSSMATALSVACMVRSDLFFKVIWYQNFPTMTNYELIEAGCVLLGVVLQILVIITAVTLVQNMSPKRVS